jgi:flagellar biosynthesis/type III secretory pathway protein FliH
MIAISLGLAFVAVSRACARSYARGFADGSGRYEEGFGAGHAEGYASGYDDGHLTATGDLLDITHREARRRRQPS